MKKQRRNEIKRQDRYLQRKTARKIAASHLKDDRHFNLRHLSGMTGVTCSTIHDIKHEIIERDENGLQVIVSPKKRAGAQQVLTDEEETMIVSHLLRSARRGFAADNAELKSSMDKIANYGRPRIFKSGVPSLGGIRSFRARHPEIRFRKSESKATIRLSGENYDHLSTYATVLKEVKSDYPAIFDHGDYIWNMDETHVNGEFGKRKSVYRPADSHHGGFVAIKKKHEDDGSHVTVVLAVSASGKKASPFLIAEGKRNMSNWYCKLEKEEYKLSSGRLSMLTEDGWFPSDACVVMVEKGSMEMRIIPLFMRHLNMFVRKYVPKENEYLLFLDGHSSRKGIERLELAQIFKCVVFQSPANTSHFLQPCDQNVNKTFQTTLRCVHDELCVASNNAVDIRNIKIKLMLTIVAIEAITPEDIRKSWNITGLWPIYFLFPERWRNRKDKIRAETKTLQCKLDTVGPASALGRFNVRRSDKGTFEALATIVDAARNRKQTGLSQALHAVAQCLQKHETLESIIASRCHGNSRTTASMVSGHDAAEAQKAKNIALPAGAPAEYLTHADVLNRRRKQNAEKEAAVVTRLEARQKQAEKRREREEKKQERAVLRAEAQAKKKREAVLNASLQPAKKPTRVAKSS